MFFVADSASWAATEQVAGSGFSSLSSSSAGVSSLVPAAEGTEADPVIVQLGVEQMALLLLWACVTSIAAAVVTVRALR